MIDAADRRRLLELAREAILAHVTGRPPIDPPVAGALALHGGAFVSLYTTRELRGCIGHIEPDEAVGRVVPKCAVAAATQDPRFPAVTEIELPDIEIEISLLGPLERIDGAGAIEIGRHGLLVARGTRRGLLLPQVATEWKWDAEAFLAHTCHKAGLSRDAWRRGAELWRFDADVFAEAPRGRQPTR